MNDEEKALLAHVWEEDDEEDKADISVDSWLKRIKEGYKVFFEDMYEEDIAARKATAAHAVLEDIAPVEEVAEQKKMLEDLVKLVETLGNQLQTVLERQNDIKGKLATVEGKKKGKKGSKKN
ncbi:putative protein-like [Raphanus sativus]|nr:putative protein-like [Raphanus sativus]